MLYNQTAKRLKAALVGREHTVIADVPYQGSEHRDQAGDREPPADRRAEAAGTPAGTRPPPA